MPDLREFIEVRFGLVREGVYGVAFYQKPIPLPQMVVMVEDKVGARQLAEMIVDAANHPEGEAEVPDEFRRAFGELPQVSDKQSESKGAEEG